MRYDANEGHGGVTLLWVLVGLWAMGWVYCYILTGLFWKGLY